jgi:hypothetical protein
MPDRKQATIGKRVFFNLSASVVRKPIMRILSLIASVVMTGMILSLTTQGLGAGSHEVVERVGPHGHVNWSQGMICVKGMGTGSDRIPQETQDGSLAQRPNADTYSNLFETIKDVRINSSCLVKDLVKKSDMIRVQLQGMVKGAQIVKREYLSNGTLEVTLGFDMTGGFAQLALPEDVKQVPEIRTIGRTSLREEKLEEDADPATPSSVPTIYTGLVVDASGLHGRPAMSPRITNESGEEVYGSAYVSREFAVQKGMVGYERDLKSARSNPRVSKNPLTVRGLRTQGSSRCDFVISNAAASKIRSSSENLLFLKKCRVIIVLD